MTIVNPETNINKDETKLIDTIKKIVSYYEDSNLNIVDCLHYIAFPEKIS